MFSEKKNIKVSKIIGLFVILTGVVVNVSDMSTRLGDTSVVFVL